MVLFTNLQSVERILYAIFHRFNEHGCGLLLAARAIRVRALLGARFNKESGLYLEPVQ